MSHAVRSVLRGTLSVDRSRLDPLAALRLALGVALPLVVGLLVDRPLDGAAAAGGAFFAGFASFAVGYRRRVRSVLLASVVIALSSFAGAAVGHDVRLLVPTVAVWGFAAGMCVSLGLAPGIIGTQAVIGLLVITQYSMPLQDAVGRAALVGVGGLLQALLVVAVWPLRRSPVERRATGEVYRSLAAYAQDLAGGYAAPPDAAALTAAGESLGDPQPFARGDGVLAFRALLDEAEQLRTTLAALGHLRALLAEVATRAQAVQALDDLAREAAGVLTAVADAVEEPLAGARVAALEAVGPDAEPQRWERLRAAARVIEEQAAGAGPARAHAGPSLLVEVARRVEDLLASLLAVALVTGADDHRVPRVRTPLAQDVGATLRANLTTRSTTYRHAVRLAVTLGLGTALAAFLPFEHRYWLPLTALVVLRPDFASTFTRGLSRILGTAVGAVVATGVAAGLQPGPWLLALLVALTAFACYAVLFANYALFGLAVTGFVVFLLSFIGLPGAATVVDRIEATVLGGLLALLAYAVWPTWERVNLSEQVARLLEAQDRYGRALLDQYAAASPDLSAAQDLRAAARLARTNAEASVARALGEPGAAAVEPLAAVGAAARRYALAALALQAHLPEVRAATAAPELARLSSLLGETSAELVASLRQERRPGRVPALRQAQDALRHRLREDPDDLDAAVLDVEVDQLVSSVLDMAVRLRQAPAVGPRRGLLRR